MRIGGMGLTMDCEVASIPVDGRTVRATGGVVVRDCQDARIGLMAELIPGDVEELLPGNERLVSWYHLSKSEALGPVSSFIPLLLPMQPVVSKPAEAKTRESVL
jgi:hypothetical protein